MRRLHRLARERSRVQEGLVYYRLKERNRLCATAARDLGRACAAAAAEVAICICDDVNVAGVSSGSRRVFVESVIAKYI